MASDDKSLHTLETLMNEFFNPLTSNERKHDIEELLSNFSKQPESWKHCFSFLTRTSNEYVMMYCLSVLEHVINKQWIGLSGEDKGEIRLRLYRFLLTQYQKVPSFISNKLGKLIVDIGRLDWPHFYPDFFVNILQLAQSSETAFLGLMLIQTSFEELTSSREDLSAARKEELHRLLLEQVPIVLNILLGHLESVLEKHCHLVTATPPPSPTHYQAGSQQNLFSTSPLHTSNLLSGMFKMNNKRPLHRLPPLDAESHRLSCLSLKCLAHLLSWIPLSSFVTASLLSTIFHYASFGCEPEPANSDVSNVGMQHNKSAELGIQAMGCINEIMSKNFIPADFEEFLLQIFQEAFCLLQHLTKDNDDSPKTTTVRNTKLTALDGTYIEKFTDFLQLFVSMHLKRFESNAQFPVLEFLALLFKYTFQQPDYDDFYSCLDVWGTFLDYLCGKCKEREKDCVSVIERYKQAILALVREILTRLQFRFNQSYLEELDDEYLDDDHQTEWQNFLRQCLEIIAKVADLLPEDVYTLVYSIFQENMEIYCDLERYVKTGSSGQNHLFITGENECRRLHCSMRDLSSVLQGIGRLVEQMCDDKFPEQNYVPQRTLESLCHLATYSNKMRFYDMKTEAPLVLEMDFIKVHAQILATLKAFCHWLALHFRNRPKFPDRDKFNAIDTVIADISVPNIIKKVPEKVTHSASHLFMSLTYSVRPPLLLILQSFQDLFTAVCKGQLHFLPIETQLVVYRSVSNALVLPWTNVFDDQQEWPARSSQHNSLIEALGSPLKSWQNNPLLTQNKALQTEAKPAILWTLRVLRDLTDNVVDASTRTKQVFHQSLQPFIPAVEYLFHLYMNQSDVSESILDFFLYLFMALRAQIGPPFIEHTIQNLLNLFTRNQFVECILNEGTSGSKVVEKLLLLLQQVVQEPGSSFKKFVPNTISLCMDQIYPVIAEKPSAEVKPTLFELLHHILLYNWRYFFKTNVITSLGEAGHETLQNEQHFTKIMEAFGHSFLQPDIRIFKQNLGALENLNNKWKLYHKVYFKTVMLGQFMNVLLQTLISKSHDLLHEEIVLTIYNMASVDFISFYSNFLHRFLTTSENLDANQKIALLQNFKHETDLPSFTQNVQRFVSDLRYYCICNSSVS